MIKLLRKRKRVTERDFKYIKELIRQGYSAKEVVNMSGRAAGTVSYIRKANSLAGYQELVDRKNSGNKEVYVNHPTSTGQEQLPPPAGNNIERKEMPQELGDAIELLEREFDNLRSAIVEVIDLTVKHKVAEYKRTVKEEMASMQAIVDAAKANNLKKNLMERLSGDNS